MRQNSSGKEFQVGIVFANNGGRQLAKFGGLREADLKDRQEEFPETRRTNDVPGASSSYVVCFLSSICAPFSVPHLPR